MNNTKLSINWGLGVISSGLVASLDDKMRTVGLILGLIVSILTIVHLIWSMVDRIKSSTHIATLAAKTAVKASHTASIASDTAVQAVEQVIKKIEGGG